MEVDHEYEDSTGPYWPELIDPIPSFWPTSNWWGSIDQMRNSYGTGDDQDRFQSSNYIPTNSNARSSSSKPKPSPYFQLLLAGLQVRLLAGLMRVFAA